jgi:hypothetical protein
VVGGEGGERAQVEERLHENRPWSYAERRAIAVEVGERVRGPAAGDASDVKRRAIEVKGPQRGRVSGGDVASSGGPSVWFPPIAWGDAPGIAAPGVRANFRHQQIRLDGELTPGAKAELDGWLASEGEVLFEGSGGVHGLVLCLGC